MGKDFRYAVRVLARSPGFAAVAVVTLAAGIGLNSAIFGIFNALLLKPMAVHEPSRLIWIASASLKPDGPQGNLTYPDFLAIRERRDAFVDAFAFTETPMSVSAHAQALRVNGQVVSGNMFDVLGVGMQLGRAFAAEEDRVPGTHPVAVIGYAFWQRVFAGDPNALGQSIVVNGQPFTIVGVAPNGFVGPELMAPADVWVPIMMHRAALPDIGAPFSPESWWLKAVARLAPGATIEQARAVLTGVARAVEQAEPSSHTGVTFRVAWFHGTDPGNREQLVPLSALLLGLTLTVLVIACANVAGLLLSRAAGRGREIGVRLALGATRPVLVRQLLTESLLLAFLAGVAGLLLGMWGTELIVRIVDLPVRVNTAPDWRVSAFTLGIAIAAGLAFGLAPALRSARQDVLPALRGKDAAPRSSRLQRSLVVGQLAVALVLLVGAGLFVRGLAKAWGSDVGFDYTDRVAVMLDLRLQNYAAARAEAFYTQLVDRVRALPGVRAATLAQAIPFGGRVFVHGLSFPGQAVDPDRRPERASVNRVWTHYFSTLRIPIVRGRDFTAEDLAPASAVAIVSETTARTYWPEGDALGQRLSIGRPEGPYLTIVGVARDVLIDEFTERPWPAVYVPHQKTAGEFAVLAWSAQPAAQTLRGIERTVRALDPDLPVAAGRPLSAYVAERLDGERALSSLLSICGALALVLAALGLYGVMAFAVARRTHEIGVRIALGASERDVVRLFVGDGLRVAGWGLAWGVMPAVAVTYVLGGQLVGVGVADPPTMIASAAVLVGATLVAAYLPARRATRVDPMVALRAD
jgi:predicted permease